MKQPKIPERENEELRAIIEKQNVEMNAVKNFLKDVKIA